MALSIVSIPGDGVTDTFTVSFALGILDRNSVTAWVTGEYDGGGNKVYRTITYLSDTLLKISGAKAGVGVMVVFTRTVSQTSLVVNYEDGDIMNETNLNTSQKQSLMLVHQVLDGRFSAFIQDISFGGFRGINVGTPINAGDAANKAYVDSVVATGAANAAAAAASAAAALASQNAAAASQASASTSATTATTQAGIATTQATNSSNSATASQTSRLASETARDKAQEWSDKPEDVFVTGTTEYSAYHWSRKALSYVLGSIAAAVHGATQKATLVDADEGMIADSAASYGLKKFLMSDLITYIFGAARTFASNLGVNSILTVGQANATGQGTFNGPSIELGQNRTSTGVAYVDFHGAVGTDFEARIIHNGGTNGSFQITQTGTGGIDINAASGILRLAGANLSFNGQNFGTAVYRTIPGDITVSTAAPSGAPNAGSLWFQV